MMVFFVIILKLPTPTSGQPWIVTSVSGKKSDSR